MSIKLIIFLIIIIIFALTASFGVNLLLEKRFSSPKEEAPQAQTNTQQTNTKPSLESTQTMTGLEIARSSAQFLDKAAKGDGTFYLYHQCNQSTNPKCVFDQEELDLSSDMITLAYLELFQKTGDQKYKAKADQTMSAILKNCQIDPNYCDRNFFALFAWYELTKEQQYRDAMLKMADRLMLTKLLDTIVADNHGLKLEMLYKITGNHKYRERLLAIAEGVLNKVPISPQVTPKVIWNSLLPAYRISANDKYLQTARNYYDQTEVLDKLKKASKGQVLISDILAMENLLELASIDSPSKHLDQAYEIAQYMVKSQWDNPQNKKFEGDYGWLKNTGRDKNTELTLHTGWIIRLFLKMADQTFTVN